MQRALVGSLAKEQDPTFPGAARSAPPTPPKRPGSPLQICRVWLPYLTLRSLRAGTMFLDLAPASSRAWITEYNRDPNISVEGIHK